MHIGDLGIVDRFAGPSALAGPYVARPRLTSNGAMVSRGINTSYPVCRRGVDWPVSVTPATSGGILHAACDHAKIQLR